MPLHDGMSSSGNILPRAPERPPSVLHCRLEILARIFQFGHAIRLCKASMISCRSQPCQLSKCRRERARFAETELQSNFGHGMLTLGEQGLWALDAPAAVIAVRRNSEGLFEASAKICRTEPDQPGKFCERNRLGHVLVNISGDDPLLPSSKLS